MEQAGVDVEESNGATVYISVHWEVVGVNLTAVSVWYHTRASTNKEQSAKVLFTAVVGDNLRPPRATSCSSCNHPL